MTCETLQIIVISTNAIVIALSVIQSIRIRSTVKKRIAILNDRLAKERELRMSMVSLLEEVNIYLIQAGYLQTPEKVNDLIQKTKDFDIKNPLK